MTKIYPNATRCLGCFQLFNPDTPETTYCNDCDESWWITKFIRVMAVTIQHSLFG